MPRKSFASRINPELLRDPVMFDLTGDIVEHLDGDPDNFEPSNLQIGGQWSETFTCRPGIPAGALDDLTGQPDQEAMIGGFMSKVLVPKDIERYEVLTHDPNRIVQIETLGEAMQYVVEQLQDHPTQR